MQFDMMHAYSHFEDEENSRGSEGTCGRKRVISPRRVNERRKEKIMTSLRKAITGLRF